MGERKHPPSPPSSGRSAKSRATRKGKTFKPLIITAPFTAREYIQVLDLDADDDGDSDVPSNSEMEHQANGRDSPSPSEDGSELTPLPLEYGSDGYGPPSSEEDGAASAISSTSSPQFKAEGKNRASTLRKRALRQVSHAAANNDTKACISDRCLEACETPLESCVKYDADFKPILTKPRWTALREKRKEQDRNEYSLEELMSDGSEMQVLDWNGRDCHPIVDGDGVVFAILGGTPRDKGWGEVAADAAKAVEEASWNIVVGAKNVNHRHGDFPTFAAGISHGGGQREPSVLVHCRRNAQVLARLFRKKAIRRISGFTNCIFRTYAPRLYHHYSNTLSMLCDKSPGLAPPIHGSAFAACSVNMGPRTVSFPHRDFANLTWGWCSITALGSFNPDLGGHIILWDLNMIIRFPPGSTILIPSALIKHSNTSILDGEVRFSIAQYSAGGLFCWAANGFQKEETWAGNATPEEIAQRREDVKMRWAHGLGMLSTLAELKS